MDINKTINKYKNTIAVIIPILVILFPLVYSFAAFVYSDDLTNAGPFLERPDPKYENCVRDTEYMRFHHWELLRSTREEIVRYGIRGEVSLDGCRDCHTSRENFCNKCHDAVSLTPDCFGCHYYP